MRFHKCENCNLQFTGQYVHDVREDNWICTNCGCVVRKWNYSEGGMLYQGAANPVHTLRGISRADARDQSSTVYRLTNRHCKEENRQRVRESRLRRYAETLEYPDAVVARAITQMNKFPRIKRIQPGREAMAALLIVSKRTFNHYVNARHVAYELGFRDLGQHVIQICKILGLSQLSNPLDNIEFFNKALGFPYKYCKHIAKHFTKACRDNGSMGTDTIMALVLYRFYNANRAKSTAPCVVDLEYIANLTFTSMASLRGYVGGTMGPCTLFPGTKDAGATTADTDEDEGPRKRKRASSSSSCDASKRPRQT